MPLTTTRLFPTVILILSAIIMLAAATGASADILVNNLGADPAKYNTVYGPNARGLNRETGGAISFSPTSNCYLNSISVIANYVSGNAASFDLALFSDNAGLPSSLIAGASRTITPDGLGVFKTYSADFGSSILLTAGTTYWAVAWTTGASNDIVLNLQKGPFDANNSTILPSERIAMYGNMGGTNPDGSPLLPYWMHMWNPGIQVTGSPVPEPSGLLALLGGIAPLVGFVGLRHRGVARL